MCSFRDDYCTVIPLVVHEHGYRHSEHERLSVLQWTSSKLLAAVAAWIPLKFEYRKMLRVLYFACFCSTVFSSLDFCIAQAESQQRVTPRSLTRTTMANQAPDMLTSSSEESTLSYKHVFHSLTAAFTLEPGESQTKTKIYRLHARKGHHSATSFETKWPPHVDFSFVIPFSKFPISIALAKCQHQMTHRSKHLRL